MIAAAPPPRDPRFPDADQVALALLIACRRLGENALLVAAGGAPRSLAALHAVAGLRQHFHRAPLPDLMRACGVPNLTADDLSDAAPWDSALVHHIDVAVTLRDVSFARRVRRRP